MDRKQFNTLAQNYGTLCHFLYILNDLFQYFDLNSKLITFTPMSNLSVSPSINLYINLSFGTSGFLTFILIFSCCIYINFSS